MNLDWQQKQKVTYCIPTWLRDRQIRENIARVDGRIQPAERREDRIAVVGFGPSLNDTWEQIRDFQYVISCSGAHKFLLERGITPTWHTEVDPRDHKIQLLGEPHPSVEYLVASTCHPKYVEHLLGAGAAVKLWHVFDSSEEGSRVLPRGEWAITGGCDVGLRALTIAAFLGFRDLHVFGMDGCARGEMRHAAAHPNGVQKYATTEYEGETFATTPGMLEAARQVWHELDQMPAVRATFYGEGLIQAMAKRYQPKPAEEHSSLTNMIAFSSPELISAEYRDLNAQLHRENPFYGAGGERHADTVIKLADSLKTRSILDYGCGKGLLGRALAEKGIPIWEYDPAMPGKDQTPGPADIVVCSDVLEHIEPEKILFVLDDLRRVTRKVGYFVIHTGPSSKKLADGRNAHLLQREKQWWKATLRDFFVIGKIINTPPLLHVVVGPKGKAKKAAA